jgi:exosome complex exonuclease DIS3/RRP44
MLKSRSFLRKTSKGSVVKVVKEHYLRDDLHCGSRSCLECPKNEIAILSAQPKVISKGSSKGHYIIPDTNVLLHQWNVIEHKAINDVIILQTVLEELKHLNSSIHARLRALISDANRRFYVFSNEHHP